MSASAITACWPIARSKSKSSNAANYSSWPQLCCCCPLRLPMGGRCWNASPDNPWTFARFVKKVTCAAPSACPGQPRIILHLPPSEAATLELHSPARTGKGSPKGGKNLSPHHSLLPQQGSPTLKKCLGCKSTGLSNTIAALRRPTPSPLPTPWLRKTTLLSPLIPSPVSLNPHSRNSRYSPAL